MNTMKNPPPCDQGLTFQTHALQMILFGPFYVRTQHYYGSLRIVSLQLLTWKIVEALKASVLYFLTWERGKVARVLRSYNVFIF